MSFETMRWIDHSDNPLIEPVRPDWMIADPCVLTPEQTPDGQWHLFANAIIQGLQHYVSDDGLRWERIGKKLFTGIRPYVFRENGEYFLFYEKPALPLGSVIAMSRSTDLTNWSDPVAVCRPEFPWEGRVLRTNGNPCLVKHEGRYRLYFAASWVFLPDCLFIEPRYIGVAEAERIEGPYVKRPEPLLGPSEDPAFRNMGAGSMKVIPPAPGSDLWYAFNNGIFKDAEGHSRSEIYLLKSTDGYDWELALPDPLIKPEPQGWKRALVYAMHVIEYQGQWRMYYNARSGWFIGKERIGLALGEEKP